MEATETVVAESSPAIEKENPLELGPMVKWTKEERDKFRFTGKAPKPAEPAPAKKSEAPAESAAEPETAKQQETERRKPKPTAEERIAQLEATIEKIRKGAGLERKAEDAPATQQPKQEQPAQPQNYQEWRKTFKAAEWNEKYFAANPNASWEEIEDARTDYLAEVRDGFKRREEQRQAEIRQLGEKITGAKVRYGEDSVKLIDDTAGEILADKAIPGVVTQMLRESEVLTDFLYTVGSKPEELASFLKMAKENPGKALRYIALTESLIREELEGKPAEKATPAKPQTPAPKVPAEVGGKGSAPPDTLVSAAQANDFRTFKAELNRRALARLKTG